MVIKICHRRTDFNLSNKTIIHIINCYVMNNISNDLIASTIFMNKEQESYSLGLSTNKFLTEDFP